MNAHWNERSVASLATYVNGFPFKPEHHSQDGVPIVRIRQLNDPTADVDYYDGLVPRRNHIETGDLVFSWSGSLVVSVWDRGPAFLNQHLYKVVPNDGVDQSWLRWALELAIERFAPFMHGSAMTHITKPMMRAVRVPTPTLRVQRGIAEFLDDQVARMDRIVELRQQQLDAVTARRVSYLAEQVEATDGSHVPLRRVLHPRQETNRPDLDVLSVYRDLGVVPKGSRADNYNKTPDDLSRYQRVAVGDLVVNKMKAWSGSVAVSPYEGIVSADYLVCRPSPAIRPGFLHHILRSPRWIGQMRVRSKGIRPSQERLYWEDLGSITVPLPGLGEQDRLVESLETVAGFEESRVPYLRSIELLRERKRSLITAAVTGQLDVTTSSSRAAALAVG